MSKINVFNHIEIDPTKRFGKPCIKGTRVSVSDILEMMAEGMSQHEIIEEHPNLSAEKIKAALLYAASQIKGAA